MSSVNVCDVRTTALAVQNFRKIVGVVGTFILKSKLLQSFKSYILVVGSICRWLLFRVCCQIWYFHLVRKTRNEILDFPITKTLLHRIQVSIGYDNKCDTIENTLKYSMAIYQKVDSTIYYLTIRALELRKKPKKNNRTLQYVLTFQSYCFKIWLIYNNISTILQCIIHNVQHYIMNTIREYTQLIAIIILFLEIYFTWADWTF